MHELTTKELDTATGGRATPPPPRLPIPYNPFAPPPPKTMERYIIGGAVPVVVTHGGQHPSPFYRRELLIPDFLIFIKTDF